MFYYVLFLLLLFNFSFSLFNYLFAIVNLCFWISYSFEFSYLFAVVSWLFVRFYVCCICVVLIVGFNLELIFFWVIIVLLLLNLCLMFCFAAFADWFWCCLFGFDWLMFLTFDGAMFDCLLFVSCLFLCFGFMCLYCWVFFFLQILALCYLRYRLMFVYWLLLLW